MRLKLFICIIMLSACLQAQNLLPVTLTAYDGQLTFTSADSGFIQLAGCALPDSIPSALQERRARYIEHTLLNKKRFYYPLPKRQNTDTLRVLLYHKYPLELFCLNADFIEKGYARLGDTTGIAGAEELLRAEQKARFLKNGMWAIQGLKNRRLSRPLNELVLSYSPEIRTNNTDGDLRYFGLQYKKGEQSAYVQFSLHYYYESAVNRGESQADRFLITSIEADNHFRYWGIHGGLSAAFGNGGHSIFKAFIPTIGLRLGWMEHIYLSANLFDFQLLQFYNPALNLNLFDGRLWLQGGVGNILFGGTKFFGRIRYQSKSAIIVQGVINHDPDSNQSTFMLGFGKNFER